MLQEICYNTLIDFTVHMSLDNFDILNPAGVNEKCQLCQVN